MCGRYVLSTPGDRLSEVFGVEERLEAEARFNIAPTQSAPVVRRSDAGSGARVFESLRWGLIPHWAEDPAIGSRLINARAETVERKPAFRESFSARRCLVPADGFYEWQRRGRQSQPYYFSRPDGEVVAMAGIWSVWGQREQGIGSFTLLTTEANETVAPIHGRMPVLLDARDWGVWLGEEAADETVLKSLLRPAPDELLVGYPVSTLVNSPRNDSSRCIEAVKEPPSDRSDASGSSSSQQRLL